jgi:hypothetical protein
MRRLLRAGSLAEPGAEAASVLTDVCDAVIIANPALALATLRLKIETHHRGAVIGGLDELSCFDHPTRQPL